MASFTRFACCPRARICVNPPPTTAYLSVRPSIRPSVLGLQMDEEPTLGCQRYLRYQQGPVMMGLEAGPQGVVWLTLEQPEIGRIHLPGNLQLIQVPL